MDTYFIHKHFDYLLPTELYDILQLREDVFQLEQNCLYKDIDDKDRHCWHLLLYNTHELVAYCRLVPDKISYEGYVSIGRVVSKQRYRNEGFGQKIMTQALIELETRYPMMPIKISAQLYLQKFYESFGFSTVGEWYLEDDIQHICMVRK